MDLVCWTLRMWAFNTLFHWWCGNHPLSWPCLPKLLHRVTNLCRPRFKRSEGGKSLNCNLDDCYPPWDPQVLCWINIPYIWRLSHTVCTDPFWHDRVHDTRERYGCGSGSQIVNNLKNSTIYNVNVVSGGCKQNLDKNSMLILCAPSRSSWCTDLIIKRDTAQTWWLGLSKLKEKKMISNS